MYIFYHFFFEAVMPCYEVYLSIHTHTHIYVISTYNFLEAEVKANIDDSIV